MEQHHQQQRRTIHNGILKAIARLSDPQYYHEETRHKLIVRGLDSGHFLPPVDRHSLQHMVDFLDAQLAADVPVVTELELYCILLSKPSDGGLEVLRTFFARSDTTLTKRSHHALKDLNLCHCGLRDEGLHIIVNGLVDNTIMDVLDIGWNYPITASVRLAHITRLLESMQLKTIDFSGNQKKFDDEVATQHFVTTLQHKNASVVELPGIRILEHSKIKMFADIKNSLIRNRQLNSVNSLLAPPPQQQQQQNAATMMLKISHKAIIKFAKVVPNNACASAIFKLFQARPQLLEKRLKRPAVAMAATATAAAVSQDQKRKRL